MSESTRPVASEPGPEPPTAEEVRADIEATRSDLADSVDALSSRLDVTAQANQKLHAGKERAGESVSRVGEVVRGVTQKAPEPVQKAVHATAVKVGAAGRSRGRQARSARPAGHGEGQAVPQAAACRWRRADRGSVRCAPPQEGRPIVTKLLYKPFGLVLSALAGAAAGRLTKTVWKQLSGQDCAPAAKDEHRRWGEIAAAAAVEGAVFGGTKAVIDRAGAKAFATATGTWPG